MGAESLFGWCGRLVLPGWLLLVVLPRWRGTQWIAGLTIPVLLGAVYLGLILGHFPGAEGGFGSLAEVARLFQSEWLLLAGWVHYLAFDLFIGGWEVRDARRLGIHHLLVVPCLALTFMFGPVGLLLYFGLRAALRRRLQVAEA